MNRRRQLGQHFLRSHEVAAFMVSASEPRKGEVALEVGPGRGIITKYLAKAYGKVYAIEKDTSLGIWLRNLPPNVKIIWGDALKVKWPKFDAFVSNLPFSIATEVLFRLSGHEFRVAVVGIQKEVAERLVAKPGEKRYSRLSIYGALFFERVEMLRILPPRVFEPPPKVLTAVVRLFPSKNRPDLAFLEFIKRVFSFRRKKLKNALELAGYSAAGIKKEILEKRVYEIRPEEFLELYLEHFREVLPSSNTQ